MPDPEPASVYPSVAEVERIAALTDPVLRNLQITQCYHELAEGLARRTGMSANWCTFATWASKQAGQTIRKEDLARALERLLSTSPATNQAIDDVNAAALSVGTPQDSREIHALVWQSLNPAAAIDRTSAAVGRGNLKVFGEIGLEFARFYAACLEDATYDAEKIARFCAELRPGDPPLGQSSLSQAFTQYYQAFFETDPKRRAELLLLANLQIGYHEQTRLQPEIAESLDIRLVDPEQFARLLILTLFPVTGWAIYLSFSLLRSLRGPTRLDLALKALANTVRQQVRTLITETLMSIGFPHGVVIRLGDDLKGSFPASLEEIADPDLRSLLRRLDPTPDSLNGSGVLDWSDLPDRLQFITDLFRCYQETGDLFEPPFTPEQTATLKAGRYPEGEL
jgi:hypothetical protein